MRTTIDLPDDLFREVKTRAVQQGTTLKKLLSQYIRSGLIGQTVGTQPKPTHRNPPPVAIRRRPDHPLTHALTNRQLNEILEEDEVSSSLTLKISQQNKQ
jgi:hypothetical protein